MPELSRLAIFLQAREPLFDHALAQLEKRTGRSGLDVKLTAELAEKSAAITRELGLKPDCSGPELYEALCHSIKEQDAHLARTLGGHDVESVAEMVPLALRRLDQIQMPRTCFALKYEVAAEILKKRPPVNLMQRLGHKTADELVANEDLAELFIAIRFTEGPEWLNDFNTVYEDLCGEDFESRPIRLVRFDRHKWGDVADHFIVKKKHFNTHSKEMGVVAVLAPPSTHLKAVSLKVITLTLHYFNEVGLYSSYFKLLAHKCNFGQILSETLIADTPPRALHGAPSDPLAGNPALLWQDWRGRSAPGGIPAALAAGRFTLASRRKDLVPD